MKRFASLFIFLAIWGTGIAIVTPADAKPRRARKTCCVPSPGAHASYGVRPFAEGESICLQYLLYEDAESNLAMWSVDHYFSYPCSNATEEYLFTEYGLSAPQACGPNSNPNCMGVNFVESTRVVPYMRARMGRRGSFHDNIRNLQIGVPTRGNPQARWKPIEGLDVNAEPSAEQQQRVVKVKNINGVYFAIRLSSGTADMNAIVFRPNGAPHNPISPIPRRTIRIGFETTRTPAELAVTEGPNVIPEYQPQDWTRYTGSKNAFRLVVPNDRGVNEEFYILTAQQVLR